MTCGAQMTCGGQNASLWRFMRWEAIEQQRRRHWWPWPSTGSSILREVVGARCQARSLKRTCEECGCDMGEKPQAGYDGGSGIEGAMSGCRRCLPRGPATEAGRWWMSRLPLGTSTEAGNAGGCRGCRRAPRLKLGPRSLLSSGSCEKQQCIRRGELFVRRAQL